jgi:flagellar hook-basal body complex protein FliE
MKEINIQGMTDVVNRFNSLQNEGNNKKGKDFETLLVDSLKEVNSLQLKANKAIEELAAGKKENIHETMIAMEKASISFQMMMQIRNKIVDAYQEILKTAM